MKRILTIGLSFGILAIAVIFIVTTTGPLTGKVFSTINSSLGTGYYGAGGANPASAEEFDSSRAAEAPAGLLYNTQQTQPDAFKPDQKRMVIKNADLTIVVTDPTAKMQAISQLAESVGGYVVSSNKGQSYIADGTKVPEGSILIRVPQEKLAEVLEKIKEGVVDVQTDTLSGQDVTKEYTDLSSQLKNLQATEKKLTEIMDKADKTEDVLAVFTQLTQIRGQIEVTVGQMKYYEQSAAMSAVNVRIVAEKTIQPIEIAGWQPQGQARDAAQALVNFFQGFVNFLIWLAIFFIPVLVVLLLLAVLFWRVGKLLWLKALAKNPEPKE